MAALPVHLQLLFGDTIVALVRMEKYSSAQLLMHPASPSATQPITRAPAGTHPSTENKWSQRSCQHYVSLYKCDAQGDPATTRYLKATAIYGEPLDTNVFDENTGNRQKRLQTTRNKSTEQHFDFDFCCGGL